MTTVSSTNGLQSLATGAGDAAQSKTSADFNMFLKMLTTQMQNQDPLDPMDTSQYTQQLVRFSQVEQTIQQTGTLKDILARLTTQDMAQASSFIGREAQFDSDVAGLAGGSPAQMGLCCRASSRRARRDAAGQVVATRAIDPTASGRFAWDGKLATGGNAADGSYTLAISGTDLSGGSVPVSVSSIGMVREVLTGAGGVSLQANGVAFAANKLLRVSQPGG